jgi:hypothetical protein
MSFILIQVEFVGHLRTFARDEFLSEKRFCLSIIARYLRLLQQWRFILWLSVVGHYVVWYVVTHFQKEHTSSLSLVLGSGKRYDMNLVEWHGSAWNSVADTRISTFNCCPLKDCEDNKWTHRHGFSLVGIQCWMVSLQFRTSTSLTVPRSRNGAVFHHNGILTHIWQACLLKRLKIHVSYWTQFGSLDVITVVF